MKKEKKIIVASAVVTAMLFNVVPPTFALNSQTQSSVNIQNETIKKLQDDIKSGKVMNEDDIAKSIFDNMTEEAKQEFIKFMLKQKSNGNSQLINYHEKIVGKINQKEVGTSSEIMSVQASSSDGPIDVLSKELDKLDLPTPAYYAFLGIGGSIVAAGIDGPLPIGDIIGIIVSVGAGAVIGYYWDDISPKWDEIVNAFKKTFSSMKKQINSALNYLYGIAVVYYYGIPNDILSDDNVVDLGSFKDKYGKTPLTKDSGTFTNGDWIVEKDTAGHIGNNGERKKWKLKHKVKSKNNKKGRVASLDKNGTIIGD